MPIRLLPYKMGPSPCAGSFQHGRKDLITEYAEDVDGVKDVKNEMTVAMKPGENAVGEDFIDDVSITAMVKTILLYHRSTSRLNTTVKTKDGVVTLEAGSRTWLKRALRPKS